MKLDNLAYKDESFDLNKLAFDTIIKNKYSFKIVSFKEVNRVLGTIFHLTRKQTFQLLKRWEKEGLIAIHPHHGVRFFNKTGDKHG